MTVHEARIEADRLRAGGALWEWLLWFLLLHDHPELDYSDRDYEVALEYVRYFRTAAGLE